MRSSILLILIIIAFPIIASAGSADTLNLTIKMTKGERSRDSGSATTSITISGNTIVYKLTYSGMRKGTAPEPKTFRLEDADRVKLIELINSRQLLVTESIERPYHSSGTFLYFVLSMSVGVNESTGQINMKGPKNAADIKESELYKNAVALIEAVYEIINRTDPKLVYEPLIR